MRRALRHQFIASWIAAFAILAAALAPALSQALQSGGPDAWAAICSSTGAKGAGPSQDGQGAPKMAMEHCPYCSWHAPVLGLPPAPLQPHLVVTGFQPLPTRFAQAPRTSHVWATAQPRAPPLA